MHRSSWLLVTAMPGLLFARTACAQTFVDASADPDIVVVAEPGGRGLDANASTGSRLGLSIRETPASLETLTQEDMQVKGLRTAREAFDNVVGAVSGNVPGNPAVVTLRGFSGSAVSMLQDGVRVSTSTIVQRDTNTWHFDRIEVVKGPASVLYGEGALAGVINKVTRKPRFDGDHMDFLLRAGSFETVEGAAGVNLRISDRVALRADASYMRSASLYDVADNATRSAGLTASILIRPVDGMSLLFAVDHYDDRYDSSYQGLPFVSKAVAWDPSDALRSRDGMVLDRALRRVSYNPRGSYSGAHDTTLRSHAEYRSSGGWSMTGDFTWYRAKRAFLVSGDQVFGAPTASSPNGSFARSVQDVRHDHRFWNGRVVVAKEGRIGGLRNRVSVGMEYGSTRFVNPRRQSPVGGSAAVPIAAVDPYDPQVGQFPHDDRVYSASNVIYDSRLKTTSAFAEDAINLTSRWLVLAGLRYDHVDLNRRTTDLNAGGAISSADPRYDPLSWRIGSTYQAIDGLTLYAQYTTAVVPVSSILVQSIANTRFEMTNGRSVEAGFKLDAFDGRLTATGAAYRIEQRNILTRDPNDATQVVQGGRQSSRGVELGIAAVVATRLSLSTGLSYTDARYDQLVEVAAGRPSDRAGNRPINTPSTTMTAGFRYDLGIAPLSFGADVRLVSGFYTDTANTYFVRGRTTIDASISYRIDPHATLAIRGRNLTDAFYGEYSGYPVTNVYIGAPRSIEVALTGRF